MSRVTPTLNPVVLAKAAEGRWTRLPDRPITGVINDSRTLKEGDLFVALAGARDGHNFVAAAFARGASAALVRDTWSPAPSFDWPLLKVRDPKAALQAIAADHRRRFRFPLVGVTGSVGKTTVKEMLAAILEAEGPTVRTIVNWNNDIGLPLSLLQGNPAGHRFGVFEIGTNHPGEIRPLAELMKPDLAVVTVIGPVHLEHFGTLEAIAREKGALLEVLSEKGIAVLNRDTPCFDLLRSRVPGRLITVALESKEANYRVTAIARPSPSELRIRLATPAGEREAWVPRPGRHQALNAALALAAAAELGVPWDRAVEGLRHGLPELPMRWQQTVVQGVGIINDAYNANTISLSGALETFAAHPCAGRKWLVLGEMKELGDWALTFHLEMGERLASGPWAGIILVRSTATEAMAEGAREKGYPPDRLWLVSDVEEAARTVQRLLQPGDWVLLKASRSVALERVAQRLGWADISEA